MKTFLIRDESGEIHNKVTNPTAIIIVDTFQKDKNVILYRIGEKEKIEKIYNHVQKTYRINGYNDLADKYILMDLPHNQEELDKCFQITGYVGKIYNKMKESIKNKKV